jgi:hypothetical protein
MALRVSVGTARRHRDVIRRDQRGEECPTNQRETSLCLGHDTAMTPPLTETEYSNNFSNENTVTDSSCAAGLTRRSRAAAAGEGLARKVSGRVQVSNNNWLPCDPT